MPPAPTAPAPAPAAPAAPAPSPAPSRQATPPAPGEGAGRDDSTQAAWMQDEAAELDRMSEDQNKPRPVRPAQGPIRKETPPKPEEGKTDEPPAPEDDDVINPGDEAPQVDPNAPKPTAEPQAEPERPLKAPELRKAYNEAQRVIKEEYQPKIATLEAKVKELESAGPKDTEETQQRFKQLQARAEMLENFVRLKHYEQSQEYLDKYQKPYEEAWDKCIRDISQLEVEVSDGKGGYITRRATDADISQLAQLPLGELFKQSNAMFGDAANLVQEHVREINRTWQAQTKALEEAKKRSMEVAQNSDKQHLEETRLRERLWVDHNTDLATKHAGYFAPIQGDEVGNKLLKAGLAFADLLFESRNLTPEKVALLPKRYQEELKAKGKLSPELTVRAHAIIRNKAANHDRLARQLRAARAELAAAQQTIKEYEGSEPPLGGDEPGRDTGGGHWSDDPNREIEELARKGPS
jgi:hypothetical protein